MSKGLKIIIVIVVVGMIAAVIALATGGKDDNTNTETTNNPPQTQNTPVEPNTNQNTDNSNEPAASITYTSSGFEPSSLTVKSGDTLKITNDSGSSLSFNSDPHPAHNENPDLNAGDIEDGQSKTITVTAKGTWGFHNHFNATDRGTITVQ